MPNIHISKPANQDAFDIFDWYESQKEGLGGEFTDELDLIFKKIRDNPERYRVLEKGIRAAKLKRFPYIVYFLLEEKIKVIAILHERRHPNSWRIRK